MPTHLTKRTFTVGEYHEMGASNIFDGERVELVEGEVIEMAPKGTKHAACVTRLIRLLAGRLDESLMVRVQDPLILSETTEVEPDFALVRSRPDFYATAHPSAHDVLLVIEVADSSLAYDREVKVPLYARAGVPEAWLVDMTEQRLLVHSSPSSDGYGLVEARGPGAKVALSLHPQLELQIEDMLG